MSIALNMLNQTTNMMPLYSVCKSLENIAILIILTSIFIILVMDNLRAIESNKEDTVFDDICKNIYFDCHMNVYKLFDLTENGITRLNIETYKGIMYDTIKKYIDKEKQNIITTTQNNKMSHKILYYLSTNDISIEKAFINIHHKCIKYIDNIKSSMFVKNHNEYENKIKQYLGI